MEAFKEKTVGFLIVSGILICILSLIAMFMFAAGGIFHATLTRDPTTGHINDMGDSVLVHPAMLGFTFGLLVCASGIVYGLLKNRSRHQGSIKTLPNVRVIARFGYTKDWNMLTEQYQFEEADDPTYYLKLEVTPGVINEYECRPETYFAAGEGMTGEVVLRGKWCGRFVPYIGVRNETSEQISTH